MMFTAIGQDGCRSHPIHQFGKSDQPQHIRLRTILGVNSRERSWQSAEEVGQVAPGALSWVDMMLASEDELHVVTGSWELLRQVEAVLSTGVRLQIRKLWSKGLGAHTHAEFSLAPPHLIRVESSIGAADGFAAGFLYALHGGVPLAECLQ